MKHDHKLQWFDLFRGVAAIVVLTGHLRALSFKGYANTKTDLVGKLFFFLTGFGHEAVVIFFVLSGFFIIRSIHEAIAVDKWSAGEYSLNRLTRLWVVLVPALVVSLVWDHTGLLFFKDSLAYAGKIEFMEGVSPVNKLGVTTFLGNLFFVQTIAVPAFGSNGALWSLANEFWYYVLFPLLYFSAVKFYNYKTRLVLIGCAGVVLVFIGRDIALYFFIWLMGGLVYLLVKRDVTTFSSSTLWVLIYLAFFAIVLSLIRLNVYPLIFNDFSLGIATTLLLTALAGREIKNSFLKRIATFLSNISYSVYVTHLPLAVLITCVLFRAPMDWSYGNFFYYLLVVLTVLVYCYGMYFLFEKNTVLVKKYIKHLGKRTIHA